MGFSKCSDLTGRNGVEVPKCVKTLLIEGIPGKSNFRRNMRQRCGDLTGRNGVEEPECVKTLLIEGDTGEK